MEHKFARCFKGEGASHKEPRKVRVRREGDIEYTRGKSWDEVVGQPEFDYH